jgi:AcrR family transcriptional regulator
VTATAANSRVQAQRTQAQRSQDTRERLMRATVDCLVERGWAGTTTTEVAERAGVSRGAQLHHYRTRSDLVIAAVEHLGNQRVEEIQRAAADLPRDGRRIEAVLQMLAGLYTGAPFLAALELWVAARTDPELHAVVAPLEARFGREAHRLTVGLLAADESRPGVREAIQSTLDFIRGLGLADVLTDDAARRARLLRAWARTLEEVLR